MHYVFLVAFVCCALHGFLHASVDSHNYATNRLEYRNAGKNTLDLLDFKDFYEEVVVFEGREFILKRQTTRYLLRSLFFDTSLWEMLRSAI